LKMSRMMRVQAAAICIEDEDSAAHAIMSAELGEAVVSSIHHQVVRHIVGVKHKTHGKGPKNSRNSPHCGHDISWHAGTRYPDSARLVTYGAMRSQPLTAKTRMLRVVMYSKLKFGMNVSQMRL